MISSKAIIFPREKNASLLGSRENAPIEFPQRGEKGAVWPPLLLQHIVYNSDAVDLQVATARTRSCGSRLTLLQLEISNASVKMATVHASGFTKANKL
ncbi:hypothetical protein AVEN_145720-1 [Araneus ventricosus]|uniref:Uncharacterized protein n=1 Tax=Araneus ventricosus TaxID=182803 RepID=A0A4Y2SWA2_ARAVE|nr:hypothetical protein AVEN_145720-1 [Araneus ventricosus]